MPQVLVHEADSRGLKAAVMQSLSGEQKQAVKSSLSPAHSGAEAEEKDKQQGQGQHARSQCSDALQQTAEQQAELKHTAGSVNRLLSLAVQV